MASWVQVLTTNMKLQPGICPPSCLPVGVCARQHVCVSIEGRHVANRKVLKKSLLSKQRTTDTGNNVASLWGHNGDVGSGNRRKWAVNYLSSSTVTIERVFFLFLVKENSSSDTESTRTIFEQLCLPYIWERACIYANHLTKGYVRFTTISY